MDHLQPEQLQQYLAGELDPADLTLVEAHLTHCAQCESLLAAIAADDAALLGALALRPEERAWIEAQDLRSAVARGLTPWYLQAHGLLLLLISMAVAGWMLQQTASLVAWGLKSTGPVAISLLLLEWVGRLCWRFLTYLGSGGPLLWPTLLVGGLTLWLRRRKSSDA